MGRNRASHSWRSQDGFTLLELMIAFFVITILLGMSVPILQGFRIRAQDRTTQTELRNAVVLERGFWQEYGAYTNLESQLKALDSSFVLGNGFKPWHPLVELDLAASGQRVCVTAQSDSGTWFSILDDGTTGRTYYGDTQAIPCTAALTTVYQEGGW